MLMGACLLYNCIYEHCLPNNNHGAATPGSCSIVCLWREMIYQQVVVSTSGTFFVIKSGTVVLYLTEITATHSVPSVLPSHIPSESESPDGQVTSVLDPLSRSLFLHPGGSGNVETMLRPPLSSLHIQFLIFKPMGCDQHKLCSV